VAEKDRWPLTLGILAERVTEILGDRAKLVYMALSQPEASRRTKSFPSVGLLKLQYEAEEPEESFVRSKGVATVGFIVETIQNTNSKDANEGEEILGLLRRQHPDGLIDFAPTPFADETGFPMWLSAEAPPDVNGGRITQTAAYSFEIKMTHTEG
jgi:hypothetical protein